ncbi:hypothetical protein BO86DRAFT_453213 [Aspergillus japonicus CBS 114.51]|uniref:Dol-P-Man:Man(5)GlcNAc(2)-PP-Dol alpha-1,3-mannosyltransferase n=2 Tax=Aspergillus TaxID=5052 RepID=A0A2V5GPU6_ASPV1|nr:hypothetical protein BO86DRAFT_453213 [Aspergillus japonicus CBS 114.51]PYI13065.1 hypothetical protein BO99DRAFT_477980 [Aspergillus violaceofuscus CBS 115571]RAH86101.1 hypothetical protein BO86DRAFT_453213 [Aspergillus japonicus CBS 114.51]
MSRMSPALKALINSPAARPNTLPAPRNIQSVYAKIQQEAQAKGISQPSWLALTTATTMTMNSPDSLTVLYDLATSTTSTSPATPETNPPTPLATAELMREVGLKCISFNGIPRTINCLNAFRASLPAHITANLSTTPTREPTPATIEGIRARGRALWDSIYRPFETKLYDKLARAHPDLPVHILNMNYGALLADPPRDTAGKVGRVLTSLVAVACLRAQTGVAPQVTSHVFGLRKAVEDGSWAGDVETQAGAEWLASEAGNLWVLESVDAIRKMHE